MRSIHTQTHNYTRTNTTIKKTQSLSFSLSSTNTHTHTHYSLHSHQVRRGREDGVLEREEMKIRAGGEGGKKRKVGSIYIKDYGYSAADA